MQNTLKNRTGIITAIQRMSIHDGPGIRSTIFMKGCNLRCRWCHNPETFSRAPEIEWIKDKCISCQACLLVCQSGALSLHEEKVQFDKSPCTVCFDCVPVCFPEALQKIGREITPGELFSEIEQDFPFFMESGGGITISGGEPMLQSAFVLEALKLFKNAGIHTAIETNMSLPWKKYASVLPNADLIMADLKLMDPGLHRKWTGGGNRQVLENILSLDRSGKPYYLRTPVVPGVNNNREQLRKIAAFVNQLKNIVKFELLPFHSLAAPKYENLGIVNPFANGQVVTSEELEIYRQLFKNNKEKVL